MKGSIPLIIVPQKIFTGSDSFPLLAVPFFILAGMLMDTGGISLRLVRLAQALVGHFRNGLGMVCVVSEIFFSGISGSTAAEYGGLWASISYSGHEPGRLQSFPGDGHRLCGLRHGDPGTTLYRYGRLWRHCQYLHRGALCRRVSPGLGYGLWP